VARCAAAIILTAAEAEHGHTVAMTAYDEYDWQRRRNLDDGAIGRRRCANWPKAGGGGRCDRRLSLSFSSRRRVPMDQQQIEICEKRLKESLSMMSAAPESPARNRSLSGGPPAQASASGWSRPMAPTLESDEVRMQPTAFFCVSPCQTRAYPKLTAPPPGGNLNELVQHGAAPLRRMRAASGSPFAIRFHIWLRAGFIAPEAGLDAADMPEILHLNVPL
jgi:hypothetical protein